MVQNLCWQLHRTNPFSNNLPPATSASPHEDPPNSGSYIRTNRSKTESEWNNPYRFEIAVVCSFQRCISRLKETLFLGGEGVGGEPGKQGMAEIKCVFVLVIQTFHFIFWKHFKIPLWKTRRENLWISLQPFLWPKSDSPPLSVCPNITASHCPKGLPHYMHKAILYGATGT